MLFSSVLFLYYFLPAVLLVYFVTPDKFRNLILLGASIIFYAWGEPKYVILMAVSVLLSYVFGLLIEQTKNSGWSKFWLVLSCITCLSMLGYFKYADFLLANINSVAGTKLKLLQISLPIGISFYTFQILSYTIDIYRGDAKTQRNILDYATYVVLFPQLIAGPIVRYVDIAQQLKNRSSSVKKTYLGLRRFLVGLAKKVLLANQLGALCAIYNNIEEKTILFSWIYAIAFTLQIYFDFSGYSDMAIGLGKVFGFDFLENFNYPYVSKSITEFWRRWHMSLGSWFRDYVYIPLGGNRVTKWRWLRNIIVVWLLTGLWHGAAWNFIVWGLFFAVLLLLEKLWLKKLLEKLPDAFCHVYVLFAVILSFVIFNGESLADAVTVIDRMFGVNRIEGWDMISLYYLRSYLMVFLIAIIASTPLPKMLFGKMLCKTPVSMVVRLLEPFLLVVFLLLTTAYLVDGSFNPFLYFRF